MNKGHQKFVTVIVLMGWFLFLGPGVLLMPFTPRGFQSVADDTNTVYYENGEESAREVLRLA